MQKIDIKNNPELISIIVPVYNTGQYLEKCIKSISEQDYPHIEILIIDDGSQDSYTIELCDKLSSDYPNVFTYHKSNGGSASARNYGIRKANGQYLGFIDSDDVIESDMFSTLYNDLISNSVRVSIGGIATEEKGKIIDRTIPVPTGIYDYREFMHHFMLGNFHSSCTNLYEKSLFDDVSFPEGEVNEDYMLNYWIFKKLDKISVNSKILYHYVRRKGSNTGSDASLRFLDWLRHTELVMDEMKKEEGLIGEAEYQYLYSNIILANKSLLTLGRMESNDATKLYKISVNNLHVHKSMVVNNLFLKGRYRKMALFMVHCPQLYKLSILCYLKVKNRII